MCCIPRLFIGIEFVSDRSTKEPGSAETSYIVSSLKDDANILTSIDVRAQLPATP